MSVDPDEVRVLARAFARHLEHLQMFRGVHYVDAGPVPLGAGAEAAAVVDAALEAEVESPLTVDNPTLKQSLQSGPVDSQPSPPSNPHRSGGDEGSLRDAARAVIRTQAGKWPAAKKLQYLRERNVGDCRRCPLAQTRRSLVFGVGDPEAEIMFIGEAPGAEEDRRGEPFVGAAGQRLDRWLEQLGLSRPQVYIANVLKCRPPRNRDPKPLEIERCSPFLHAQVRAIEPKVIVALGRFAGCLLLERDMKMYQMRGQVHRYREPKSGVEFPVVVTYHPSYVIRREREPQDRRAAAGRPDRSGAIKSEDQKVLDDLTRAVSLARGQAHRGPPT